MKNPLSHYFSEARSWNIDKLYDAKMSAKRWFIGFLLAGGISLLLALTLIILLPLKTFVPMVVQYNTKTGEVWVHKPSTPYMPETNAQVQADLVRYIVTRESYSAADINQRFRLVMLLSSSSMGDYYANEQANNNPKSPINQFGVNGSRTVQIEDIVFLNKTDRLKVNRFPQTENNLAKVDFNTTSISPQGQSTATYWVATIAWTYRGLPENIQDAWDNWNGFTVTTYRVDPRQVASHSA